MRYGEASRHEMEAEGQTRQRSARMLAIRVGELAQFGARCRSRTCWWPEGAQYLYSVTKKAPNLLYRATGDLIDEFVIRGLSAALTKARVAGEALSFRVSLLPADAPYVSSMIYSKRCLPWRDQVTKGRGGGLESVCTLGLAKYSWHASQPTDTQNARVPIETDAVQETLIIYRRA